MPRGYSEQFLLELARNESDKIGVELARLCVKANIPLQYIAEVCGVSRMTVHNWFRGLPLRDKNDQRVKSLAKQIKVDLDTGKLPAITHAHAKEYLTALVDNTQ